MWFQESRAKLPKTEAGSPSIPSPQHSMSAVNGYPTLQQHFNSQYAPTTSASDVTTKTIADYNGTMSMNTAAAAASLQNPINQSGGTAAAREGQTNTTSDYNTSLPGNYTATQLLLYADPSRIKNTPSALERIPVSI